MAPIPGDRVYAPELRYLNQPKPLRVLTDHLGVPRMVAIGKKGKRVQRIRDRWRVDDGWWREPLARTYYELELAGGEIVTVYHDEVANCWYRQWYE